MSRELLQRLIEESPKLHGKAAGEHNWGVAPAVLQYLYDRIEPGMRTLETGAGYSTIVFALAGADHICINPNRAECERISRYCEQLCPGSSARIRFVYEPSDTYLPGAQDLPHDLDVVFIDGAHRYPLPAIDWYYTDTRLKVGGLLVADDVNIPSVKHLDDFLRIEDAWMPLATVGHTAFYRKVAEAVYPGDWPAQKTNAAFLRRARRPLPRRIIHKLRRLVDTFAPTA